MKTSHVRSSLTLLVAFTLLTTAGCYRLKPSSGGGQTDFEGPRRIDPADIALPEGYRIEAVATDLTFPTGVAFDDRGVPHVIEAGYSYGEVVTVPRLLRITPGSAPAEVVRGDNGPWNGVAWHEGAFYIAGGHLKGGQLLRVSPDGRTTVLLDKLPSWGDHHTNGPVIRNGFIYFGQGTATNSGVVGIDNLEFGWLPDHPDFHDIPCQDITLAGPTFTTDNPLTPASGDRAVTGAFQPFGQAGSAGQTIQGQVPCSGAVMRLPVGGGTPQLVAWGFRNPFGLAFAPDGSSYVTENAYDDRGSRKVWGTGDYLWKVTPGAWYGWPDYSGGVPLNNGKFEPPMDPEIEFLLALHPGEVPTPTAQLGVHSSSNGIDFSRTAAFGFEGEAFIAQFGDMAPDVGKVMAPVGFQVKRVDVQKGTVHGFAANRGRKVGPASKIGGGGFERPVGVRFSPDGTALYVVDFGVMTMSERGPVPRPNTGVLWRITRGASR